MNALLVGPGIESKITVPSARLRAFISFLTLSWLLFLVALILFRFAGWLFWRTSSSGISFLMVGPGCVCLEEDPEVTSPRLHLLPRVFTMSYHW